MVGVRSIEKNFLEEDIKRKNGGVGRASSRRKGKKWKSKEDRRKEKLEEENKQTKKENKIKQIMLCSTFQTPGSF